MRTRRSTNVIASMTTSRHIAGLAGPTIVAMIVSEFPLVQPHLYDAQIRPVVYLSGAFCSWPVWQSYAPITAGYQTGRYSSR
jgi:hypothetical protein